MMYEPSFPEHLEHFPPGVIEAEPELSTPVLQVDDELREFIHQSLLEDIGSGDVTTIATIPAERWGTAQVRVKETGILCGMSLFVEVYRMISDRVKVYAFCREGHMVSPGRVVFRLSGPMGDILTGERVALNILGMMSGAATATSEYVKAVSHTHTRILDTRKTIPRMRRLQKYSVLVGGGMNHRSGLYDMVLIKDNHIDSAGGISQAVQAVREHWGDRYPVEVETRNLDEVQEAIEAGVDRIMLDNMDIDTMREAVELIGGRIETEASGGVNLHTVSFIAETGIDFISIGALTHSMRCLDFSLSVDR